MSEQHQDLADFITAEVARQSSNEAVRVLVEKKIAETIASAVDRSLRSFGDVGKQIEAAVVKAMQLSEPLDVPAYGTMVMAVLRAKMDEILTPLVNERLGAEMEEILKLAPAEVKLSAIVEAMKADEDISDRFGSHCTVIVEESEAVAGYHNVYLDPGELETSPYTGRRRSKFECEAHFATDSEGKVYSLTIDRKDVKETIRMGAMHGWKQMLFAAYACGGKVIVDGGEDDFNTGYGDF